MEQVLKKEAEERPRRSLGDIVASINATREAMLAPGFDPALDIGSLVDGDVEDLMRKVDNTVAYNRALADFAANCEQRAAAELAAAERARKLIKGNETYVMMQLELAKADEFVGHSFRYRKVLHSAPVVIPLRDPTETDFVALGEDFVRVSPPTPAAYAWNKAAIAKVLKTADGPTPLSEVARIEYNSKLACEPLDKPIEKKKRGKAK